MSSPIPIQNIYYLLLYAWNQLEEGEVVDVSSLESQELVDLLAWVLVRGTKHLLRRGLDQHYILHEEEIAGVRGRILVAPTMRGMLMEHGRTRCEFDELSVDCLPNQILLSTARRLLRSSALSSENRNELRGLNRELGGISEIPLSKRSFRTVQLHSNNRFYKFLLNVCELALDLSLIDENSGNYRFQDFIRDEKKLARLFENFVLNFLARERPDLSIGRDHIYWNAESDSDPTLAYLPRMETDISVRSRPFGRTLIIDTKFYKDTFSKRWDKESIHSAHLYQLFAYLKNLEIKGGADAQADGMLLYPVVERSVKFEYQLKGHRLTVRTLNLAADWSDIRRELLDIVPADFSQVAA